MGKNHVAAGKAETGKEFRGEKRGEIACENKDPGRGERKKERNEPEIRPGIGKSERFQQDYDELHSGRRFAVSGQILGRKHRTAGTFAREKRLYNL